MKKKNLGGLLQYGLFMLVVLITVLYITAYDRGYMPFVEDEYVFTPDPNVSLPPETPEQEVSEEEDVLTATELLASMQSYKKGDSVNVGVYDGSQLIVKRSTSSLGDLNGARLSVIMGFIHKTSSDGTVSIYDSELNDVTDVLSGFQTALVRDVEGRPLFYSGGYYYLENGSLVSASYDAVNSDKGVDGYRYPSYLATSNSDYTVFGSDGAFGVRRNSDGKVVIDAVYADVYAPSEGYIIAVGKAGGLYLFNTEGTLITDKYQITADQKGEENMIGYFFVQNGLLRACDGGKEVVLNTNGIALRLPSDYTVKAYSDGVILMQSTDGNYGYYSANGKWLGMPYYEDAKPFYEGLAVVCKNGLYGMIDTEGNAVLPCVFDSISDCQDGVIVAFTEKNGYSIFNKVDGKQ